MTYGTIVKFQDKLGTFLEYHWDGSLIIFGFNGKEYLSQEAQIVAKDMKQFCEICQWCHYNDL